MPTLAVLFLLQALSPPPLAGPDPACFVHETIGGVRAMRYIGDRACVDFGPVRTIEGIWVNAFEGSSFHEGARTLDDVRGRPHTTWLTFDDASVKPPGLKPLQHPPHAHRLTFVGRTAKDMHRKPLEGYGHFGMSPGVALVDRVTEWRDLGPIEAR